MARCAHLGKADLAMPGIAAVDLVAERDLPWTPHLCQAGRDVKDANRAHVKLRSPGERANAQLKTWRILR